MLTMKHLRESIRKSLRLVTDHVADCVARDMTDINRYAEDFYCGLLNTAFGYRLRNLNREKKNYPAIDLADDVNGIGVQVTSTVTRDKVTKTLKKFFEGKLDEQYSRLILLVIGSEDDFSKPFRVERDFDFDPARDIWDTPMLLDKLESIGNIDTLRAVDEYLQKHMSIGQPRQEPLLDLPMGSAMRTGDFVGRERELRLIAEALDREGVAFLSGLGGMGKTELALRYGQDYRDAGRGIVYFVRFTGSFRQTVVEHIAPNIPGFSRDGMNEAQIYAGAMAVLHRCGRDDLLILDNADDAKESVEQLRRELNRLPLRVLVTTRAEDDGAIPVVRMENEKLHDIFRNHKAAISEADMDELIAAVDGHTLTVDLMARLLRRERRTSTFNDLRDALTKRNLENADLGAVGTTYSGNVEQARINEHLKTVFYVAKLGKAEQTLLRFASLLPDCGLDVDIFANAAVQKKQEKKRGFFARLFQKREEPPILETPRKVLDTLQTLADGGWLEWTGDILKIHPVICIVCREELKPNEENCGAFVMGVWGWYDKKNYDHVRYRQLAELLTNASETLGDPDGWYIGEAGYFWLRLAESQQALRCNLRAVKLREYSQPDSKNLAVSYNNVGSAYRALGNYTNALDYELRALEIRKRVLPTEYPVLATSFNNVGSTHSALGDHATALGYLLKALAIWEKVLPPEHPELATSFNNVGITYGALGDYATALEYLLKALAIREKVLLEEHPDLAQSYNNVGLTYGALGDHDKALEYQLKALTICEKVLPPEHPDLAQSYSNLNYTYGKMGEREKAQKYALKALAIREKVLPPNHPDLALSCNNLAWTYYKKGEYGTALAFMRRAAEIAERSLPEGHPWRKSIQDSLEQMEREARQRRGEE